MDADPDARVSIAAPLTNQAVLVPYALSRSPRACRSPVQSIPRKPCGRSHRLRLFSTPLRETRQPTLKRQRRKRHGLSSPVFPSAISVTPSCSKSKIFSTPSCFDNARCARRRDSGAHGEGLPARARRRPRTEHPSHAGRARSALPRRATKLQTQTEQGIATAATLVETPASERAPLGCCNFEAVDHFRSIDTTRVNVSVPSGGGGYRGERQDAPSDVTESLSRSPPRAAGDRSRTA
jgi:hypothetical protein